MGAFSSRQVCQTTEPLTPVADRLRDRRSPIRRCLREEDTDSTALGGLLSKSASSTMQGLRPASRQRVSASASLLRSGGFAATVHRTPRLPCRAAQCLSNATTWRGRAPYIRSRERTCWAQAGPDPIPGAARQKVRERLLEFLQRLFNTTHEHVLRARSSLVSGVGPVDVAT